MQYIENILSLLYQTINKMKITRQATKADFRVGTTLITGEGFEFTITEHYTEGIWNTNKPRVVMESEAQFYNVEVDFSAQIEQIKVYAQSKGFDFETANPRQLDNFMLMWIQDQTAFWNKVTGHNYENFARQMKKLVKA